MKLTPLPKNTQEAFRRTQFKSDNLGLLFHKFGFFEKYDGNWILKEEHKKRRLEQFKDTFNKACNDNVFYKELLKKIEERQKAAMVSYKNWGWDPVELSLSTAWRIIVGLGSAGVLEGSGMTLHRIYGIPYIPASAQKGVLRHYLVAEKGLKEGDRKFLKIFGSNEQKGEVIFFDAFPVSWPMLELDIINAHYGDYYSGKEPPADYLKPNPVYFVTVGKGRSFHFHLISKDNNLLAEVKNWLKDAIQEFGIGAKTHAGYGEMR